jgi:hypothetical protein
LAEERGVALRCLAAAVFGLLLASGLCGAAVADILVSIDKSDQRMTVSVDGAVRHVWPVSTGRAGYGTPNGRFRPQWMARRYFSRKYYNSPMPYSIFFHGGFAIHGTEHLSRLGGPASHGCVRLSPRNAATLFALVKDHGKAHTRIVVTGDTAARSARSTRSTRSTHSARSTRSAHSTRSRADRAERRARHRVARSRRFDGDAEIVYRARAYHYPAPRFYRVPAYARWYYRGYSRY